MHKNFLQFSAVKEQYPSLILKKSWKATDFIKHYNVDARNYDTKGDRRITYFFEENFIKKLNKTENDRKSNVRNDVASPQLVDRKISKNTTSERNMEEDELKTELGNLQKKRNELNTRDSQERKCFTERRQEKYNEINKINEDENNWNEYCRHQRISFDREEEEIRYKLRSKNITI